MQNRTTCFLILLNFASGICGMEHTINKEIELKDVVHIVVVPGIGAVSIDNEVDAKPVKRDYIRDIFPQFENVHYTESPQWPPDLGQEQCLECLKKTMDPLIKEQNVKRIILHGSSMGTATTLNYVAEHPDNVKMVILEGTIASGNNQISLVAETISPLLTKIPLNYYVLPYLAKVLMSFFTPTEKGFEFNWGAKFKLCPYWPTGKQSFLSIEKIPHDLPIILLHSIYDMTPFEQARIIYEGLKNKGHDNVYLLPIIEKRHDCLLDRKKNQKEIAALYTILQKHNLLPDQNSDTNENVDLTIYQPQLDSAAYTKLYNQEWYFILVKPFCCLFTLAMIAHLLGS